MNGLTARIFCGVSVGERRRGCATGALCALFLPLLAWASGPGNGAEAATQGQSEPERARERENARPKGARQSDAEKAREAGRAGDGDDEEEREEEERERAQGKSPQEIAEEKRRRALARKGPAVAGSPLEQGVHSLVHLRVPGAPDRHCSGVLVGMTTATVMVLTSARCLAGSAAEPPAGVELNFAGGPPYPAPIVRLEPRWAAAQRARKAPPPGSDLAVVMAAAPPPAQAAPLFLLDPDKETLGELRERGVALLGFGDAGPLGRTARLTPGTSKSVLGARPRGGACGASDAGGALTAFIPPETYLLGLLSPPSKAGTCEAVLPGADPGLRAFLLSLQPLLGIDVKRCTRSARTTHVACSDLGEASPLPRPEK
jgi:hypothetical protein